MPKLGPRSTLRQKKRAEERAERKVAARENVRLEREARQRREDRKRFSSVVEPILAAWKLTAKEGQAPLFLHQFVITYGAERGWSPSVIQEHIDLAQRYIDLELSQESLEQSKKIRDQATLPPDAKVMLDIPLDTGAPRRSLRQVRDRDARREKAIAEAGGSD